MRTELTKRSMNHNMLLMQKTRQLKRKRKWLKTFITNSKDLNQKEKILIIKLGTWPQNQQTRSQRIELLPNGQLLIRNRLLMKTLWMNTDIT